ncbi:hypothetical protein AAE478_006822 [Parahypoxylon ruwenzoriense]
MTSGADINRIEDLTAGLERFLSLVGLRTTESPRGHGGLRECAPEHITPVKPLPGYDDLEADMLEDFFESEFGRAAEDSADEHSESNNPTKISETEWQARLQQGGEALNRLFKQPRDNEDRVDLARMKAFKGQKNIFDIFRILSSLFPFMLRKGPVIAYLLQVLIGHEPVAAPDSVANPQDLADAAAMMEDVREENPHIKQFPPDPEFLFHFVSQLPAQLFIQLFAQLFIELLTKAFGFTPRSTTRQSQHPNRSGLDSYNYTRLPKDTSIRLLRLDTQSLIGPETELKFKMEHCDLDTKPDFYAVSYVWGDHRPRLNDQQSEVRSEKSCNIVCDGKNITVTINLLCFLNQLATANSGRLREIQNSRLWIDQICINQDDNKEVERQIPLMGRIYSESQGVVAWLGEKDNETELALELLDSISSHVSEDRSKVPIGHAKAFPKAPEAHWMALGSLLSRKYFTRAWIAQEVILAKKLLLFCGPHEIVWDQLVAGSHHLLQSQAGRFLPKWATLFRSSKDCLRFDRWRPPLRFDSQLPVLLKIRNSIDEEALSPEDFLLLGRLFDASKAEDKFYAMLGLHSERAAKSVSQAKNMPELPPVCTGCSMEKATRDFIKYHIECSKTLRALSLVEDRSGISTTLPSWMPDMTARLRPWPMESSLFDGKPSSPWKCCGSADGAASVEFNEKALVIKGMPICSIGKVAVPFTAMAEREEWFQLFQFLEQIPWPEQSDISLGDAAWRTLTMSPDPPRGRNCATQSDLSIEFGDWCVSLIYSILNPDISLFELPALFMREIVERWDGNDIAMSFTRKTAPMSLISQPPSIATRVKSENEEWGKSNRHSMATKLEQSLVRLSEKTLENVFPTQSRILETLRLLGTSGEKTDEENQDYQELQAKIKKFNVAIELKLDSRRMFATEDGRLAIGPQSLEVKDEVWVLVGANVPFVLRRVGEGEYRLIGEAFLFGAMHGEALGDGQRHGFRDVRLV